MKKTSVNDVLKQKLLKEFEKLALNKSNKDPWNDIRYLMDLWTIINKRTA